MRDLVINALCHYATILNRSVTKFDVVQMRIEIVKANLITESYFAEELIEYASKNGIVVGPDTGNTIFHYSKIRKTIFNALDCYADGLKNTIKIMFPNSTDPHSDFYSMEQEIKMCTGLMKEIEDEYGNISTVTDEALF
ncbi:MAG: hypothetical protein ABR515_08765 [Nitrososphaeraceae archaeon]